MAYRLLYGTGVISGIGERSDHSTVSVELASSHVPWDVSSEMSGITEMTESDD